MKCFHFLDEFIGLLNKCIVINVFLRKSVFNSPFKLMFF